MHKISHNEVTPFGGIHIAHQWAMSQNLIGTITDALPQRPPNTAYRYSDLILSRCYTAFCGGSCAEAIGYVGATLERLEGLAVPSPDTLLRMETELAAPTRTLFSGRDGKVENHVNVNMPLNGLLVGAARHLGVPAPVDGHCLDFDHQFIPTQKHDAKNGYKMERGYFPAVASIGNVPVHVEGRNGNSSVRFDQLSTLKRCFACLWEQGIRPGRCRMDCGSYIGEVCDWLEDNGVKFHIRAQRSDELLFEASLSEEWADIEVGHQAYQVCSIDHRFGGHVHRVICQRRPNRSGQVSTITMDAYTYRFIITNDRGWDEERAIGFYNARGGSERLFDIQNNDFNWAYMPYSFLDQNTAYLIVMAICHVVYQWLAGALAAALDFIEPGQRLKRFRFRLICIAAKVVRRSRQWQVTFYTHLDIPASALSP